MSIFTRSNNSQNWYDAKKLKDGTQFYLAIKLCNTEKD